jgi:hypothetical protein
MVKKEDYSKKLTYQRVEDKRPKEGKDLELICSFSI